jgi:hypothetical protein
MDAVCTAATEDIQKIKFACRCENHSINRVLLRLHEHASAVGFFSLASAAARLQHDSVESKSISPLDLSAMSDLLAAELQLAVDAWNVALARYSHAQKAKILGIRSFADPRLPPSAPSAGVVRL